MSGISGFDGYLFHHESRWRTLSAERFRFALLHAPRGLHANPRTQRKFGDLYKLFAARFPVAERLTFLAALDHKEQGSWGEPERFWTVIVEDHDMGVVSRAATHLAARIGAEATRTRAYRLRAAHHGRSEAVLDGARRAAPLAKAG